MTGPDTRLPLGSVQLPPGGVDVAECDRVITHPAEGPRNLWPLTARHDLHLRHPRAQVQVALESAG